MSLRVWDERVVPRLADLGLWGHAVGEHAYLPGPGLSRPWANGCRLLAD